MVSVRSRLFSEQPHTPNFFFCVGGGLKMHVSRARAPEGTPREGARADFVSGKYGRIYFSFDAMLFFARAVACVCGRGLNDAVAMESNFCA